MNQITNVELSKIHSFAHKHLHLDISSCAIFLSLSQQHHVTASHPSPDVLLSHQRPRGQSE